MCCVGKLASTSQKHHHPDLGIVTRHQYGIFARIPQTSFHLVANCGFSQVRSMCELTVIHLTLNMRGVK